MKILSKFQDFYEFDCYRYGDPTPYPVWERNEEEKRLVVDKNIGDKIESLFLHPTSPSSNWRNKYTHRMPDHTSLHIDEIVIGIYPTLYYIPIVYFYKTVPNPDGPFKTKELRINLSPIDSILLLTEKNAYIELLKNYGLNYKKCLYPQEIIKAGENLFKWNAKHHRDINTSFTVDWPELFDMCGSPILWFENNLRIKNYLNPKFDFAFYKDVNLSKTNLLEYYPEIVTERHLYNELENYFISKIQEPISEPTNEHKIVSHGFDLKASFRKM